MADDIQEGPAQRDLYLYAGDNFSFYFRLYDQVFDVTSGKFIKGEPLNLTGYSFRAQCRASKAATDPLFTFTVTPSNQSTVDSRGFILVSLTPTETTNAAASASPEANKEQIGVWDFEITEPDGDVTTLWAGGVYVTADVTR